MPEFSPTNRFVVRNKSLVIITRCLYSLFILSLLASGLPFQPMTPVWYMRLVDASVSNAPVLLLAIVTTILSIKFIEIKDNYRPKAIKMLRIIRFWLALYLLLVPLQLMSYGWFFASSADGLARQIGEIKRNQQEIKDRMLLTPTVDSLHEMMRSIGIVPINTSQISLDSQRQSAVQAVDNEYSKLEAGLRSRRTKLLVDLLPGTLRNSIGGVIIIATLFALGRQF